MNTAPRPVSFLDQAWSVSTEGSARERMFVSRTPANLVEPGNVSISITPRERGPLLSSARELESVKADAIEHARRIVGDELVRAAELDRHRAELGEVRAVVGQLERPARVRQAKREVTARRALLDEIVHSALIAEGQELADEIMVLEPQGDLHEITSRLRVMRRLIATLARVRA